MQDSTEIQRPLSASEKTRQIELIARISTEELDIPEKGELIDLLTRDASIVDSVILYQAAAIAHELSRPQDALFLFYAGQIRKHFDSQRFNLSASGADGIASLLGALNETIGSVINPLYIEYPQAFDEAIGKIERWNVVPDSKSPFYPSRQYGEPVVPNTAWDELAKTTKQTFLEEFAYPIRAQLQDEEKLEAMRFVKDFNQNKIAGTKENTQKLIAYQALLQTKDQSEAAAAIANPDAIGRDGHPQIFEAIEDSNHGLVARLLASGADLEAHGFAKGTPVLEAALTDNWIIVEMLLEAGANPLAADEHGITLANLVANSRIKPESNEGQALTRVRGILEDRGVLSLVFTPQEVRDLAAAGDWPPASQDDLEQYQTEADVVRVQALAHWASLIEEYYEKTGSYPLINDIDLEADAQLYVFIARDEQWQAVADQQSYLPENAYIIYPPEFMYSLEKGLGRQEDIEERYDPQNVSSGAPNFMIYMTQDNNYYLAAHFLNTYSFTAPVRAYQKVEVTNIPEAPYQITYADLQNDADFQRLRSETITSGWFKELIDKNKDRFREEPYHADKAYDIDFTLISGGGFKSLTTLQRTNTQTPSSTISADPKDRLDAYIATNYKNVPLTLTKVQESTSEHIFKANLTDANNTFFLYFVVPTDNTQSILPTSDISQIP